MRIERERHSMSPLKNGTDSLFSQDAAQEQKDLRGEKSVSPYFERRRTVSIANG